jgi:hypothetical protein
MWRKVLLFVVVGLLVSGLLGVSLAENPPRRGFGSDPGPKPWQCGDPDWPSYSRDVSVTERIAVEDQGIVIRPFGMEAYRVWSGFASDGRDKRGSRSRLYTMRVLGLTIVIRR